MPIALGIRGPAYTSPISASTIGETIAPATPWASRAPTRSSIVGAAPQAADASDEQGGAPGEHPAPPQRSPSRVTAMRRALKVRPYPATTHSRPLSEAWRSRCIEGSATLTMKKSRTTRKIPPMRTASGPQPASLREFGEFMSGTLRSPLGGGSSRETGLTLPQGESVGWRHDLGRPLLSIGEFSRMTFLSVKTLRHYHETGLLAPAHIDPSSGYRYYDVSQVTTAQVIRRFRDLDLPIERLRAFLDAPDEEARNAVIVDHLNRMSAQLQETQATVDSLRRMLVEEDGGVPGRLPRRAGPDHARDRRPGRQRRRRRLVDGRVPRAPPRRPGQRRHPHRHRRGAVPDRVLRRRGG